MHMLFQAAYPMLKASGAGKIIMISSVAGGPTALRSGTIYAMTKGAAHVQLSSSCGASVYIIALQCCCYMLIGARCLIGL